MASVAGKWRGRTVLLRPAAVSVGALHYAKTGSGRSAPLSATPVTLRSAYHLGDPNPFSVSRVSFRLAIIGDHHEPRGNRVGTQLREQHRTDERDLELLQQLTQARKRLTEQIGRRIIGQLDVIDNLVAAILAGGHVLLVGVPGVAKTLLIQTLSQALDLSFNRVQFTPDLMPADITGTELLEEDHATGRRVFKYVKGPVFANIVLADEINRAPPKTQAALLQAMQEHTVTAAGQTHALPEPFFVLATQNPIEQEATYPLPEAQLDRFMFELRMGYPSKDDEERIVVATTGSTENEIVPVLHGSQVSSSGGSRHPRRS
jgi:hypothetical protein